MGLIMCGALFGAVVLCCISMELTTNSFSMSANVTLNTLMPNYYDNPSDTRRLKRAMADNTIQSIWFGLEAENAVGVRLAFASFELSRVC